MLELTRRQHMILQADENILWCGKSRPTLFFRGWLLHIVTGLVWGAIVYLGPIQQILVKDGWGIYNSPAPYRIVVFYALGILVLPVLLLLFSPVTHLVFTRCTTWIVTTERVIRFFGPFRRYWQPGELLQPIRVVRRKNGCSDFIFYRKETSLGSRPGKRITEWSIDNISSESASVLDAAFCRLTGTRSEMADGGFA